VPPSAPLVFLTASDVATGEAVVFDNSELTTNAVLASASLPIFVRAVEVKGRPMWDGGYSGNPALWPIARHTDIDDIRIVQINPVDVDRPPQTAREQRRPLGPRYGPALNPARSKRQRRTKAHEPKHFRIYWWAFESAAYRSLSCRGRCLLHELLNAHNGHNNGEIPGSIRWAMERLNAGSFTTALNAYRELQDRIFIKRTAGGCLGSNGTGEAARWFLTMVQGPNGEPATKEFMRWTPRDGKNQKPATGIAAHRYGNGSGHGVRQARNPKSATEIIAGNGDSEGEPATENVASLVNHPIGPRKPPCSASGRSNESDERPQPEPCLAPRPDNYTKPRAADQSPRRGGWFGARGTANAWPENERRAAGLTQAQLAELSGVQRPYIATTSAASGTRARLSRRSSRQRWRGRSRRGRAHDARELADEATRRRKAQIEMLPVSRLKEKFTRDPEVGFDGDAGPLTRGFRSGPLDQRR
jgi:hypothetical protein